ncbi:unnamed protein product, partial [Staurois parvus]
LNAHLHPLTEHTPWECAAPQSVPAASSEHRSLYGTFVITS